ncbi:sperm acrosome membrane-associated protein 4-like [Amblyraja radiata]|uniref:sperm acrosome membrane-associated protein 4-like n=1 Tax=Amblyraja radiata TaxID=386614 RepID=UPI001402363F|nr:sperm acrosome membrane-associated protein 4-like [Amblyraja radiata]
MKLLFLAVLFVYSIAPGAGLRCFQCGMSSAICHSKATCGPNESCFTRTLPTSPKKLFTSGCTEKNMCGKHVTEVYLHDSYPTTTQCCNGDLCNGALAVQASVLAIPIMVLAWFLAF